MTLRYCNNIINWLDSKRSRPYAYAIVVGVVLSILIAAYIAHYQRRCERRFLQIKSTLKFLRAGIHFFSSENGKYPDSFDELARFCEDVGGKDSWFKMYIDLSSDRRSDISEHRELNDKGGYYYDPNTGEVRLNLTRPIKEYLPRYKGRYKDQVPSNW